MTETIDYSLVYPYSAKFSIMFQCHLNAELCVSRFSGIQYLFKYVDKGKDQVTVQLVREQQNYDESGHSQDALYVFASETLWRLFQFENIYKNPNVVCLDVHLENNHPYIFEKALKVKLQSNQDLAER